MLTVYRSNRAEWLAELLSEQLRVTPPALSETIEIAVSTWPTSRWLGEQISIANGINAQIIFPFPGTYLRKLVATVLELEVEIDDKWKANHLVWSVLDQLPEILNSKQANSLKKWMAEKASQNEELNIHEWHLAKSIAEAFDDYILYRPDLIKKWSSDLNINIDINNNLPSQSDWQPLLFKSLLKSINIDPFAIQAEKAIKALQSKTISSVNLPSEVRFFGISSLAPIHVDFIQALSGVVDVEIFLLTPCKDLWQRSKTRRQQLEEKWMEPLDGSWLVESPRLEANLGRMGAEFQQLLEGSGEYLLGEWKERDLFALPVQIAQNLSREATLIEQLQQNLVSKERLFPLHRQPKDNSLLFIECPGVKRQVQVIRDQIIQLLANDKTLEARDILIMTPQVDRFAPLIASVFNDRNSTKVDLPWRVTDRSQEQKTGIGQFVLLLIDIASKKLTASNLENLLSNSSFLQHKQIKQEEIDELTKLLQKTGFRWGINSTDKDGDETHSLHWCLNRWLLGLIIPKEHGRVVGDIAPFTTTVDPKKIMRWWDLLTKLSDQIIQLRSPKTCCEWVDLLKDILKQSRQKEDEISLDQTYFLNVLDNWKRVANGCELKLSNLVVKDIITDSLKIESGRFGHRSGSITVSALEPMRAIPHRVIILMGLDESVFPNTQIRPSFNLLEKKRHLGDPRSSDKDRYTLLEAIMSTREKLIISWNSRDERTGEPLQISPPVQQWINYLQNELSIEDFKGVLLQPPINPLDPDNFLPCDEHPPLSCDEINLQARLYLNNEFELKSMALAIPLSWGTEGSIHSREDITYEKIQTWLTDPQLAWLEQQQLKQNEWSDVLDDLEDLSLNELQRYTLLKERLEGINAIDSQSKSIASTHNEDNFWEKATLGTGRLPPKSASIIETDLLERRWENIFKTINQIGRFQKQLIDLESGSIECLWVDDYHLIIEIGRLKAKSIMKGWLLHLELCSKGLAPKGTIIIARTSSDEYQETLRWNSITTTQAKIYLENLKALVVQGYSECWPIPPESGWALAIAQRDSPEKANEIFARKWNGQFNVEGEKHKLTMKLCFGDNCKASVFLQNHFVQKALLLLYEPIIKNLYTPTKSAE